MKKVFLLLWLLTNLCSLSAQTRSAMPQLNYQGRDYTSYFARALRYPPGFREACATRVAFTVVKFQIDEQGKFALLTVEGSVSDSIKQYLRTEFARTSGHWVVATAGGKPVRSKVYVQPILFRPTWGCDYLTDYDEAIDLVIAAAHKKRVLLDLWHIFGYYDSNPVRDTTFRGMPTK
ncbi:MAG: hypothetical protein AVDCRST_MAG56-7011 [uncultured Cytophagales bacterium]|uniref:TonB C-terminal domain-containing protein n=1 Tax=uncultured Cytophagales bacterium TaxID=158755 RepID=A0A6J4L4T1_9SPHI|nr:MAG: hypothetical protein AVDCRST_MAG56-7011 [uncultured Cytophagales bacterium]